MTWTNKSTAVNEHGQLAEYLRTKFHMFVSEHLGDVVTKELWETCGVYFVDAVASYLSNTEVKGIFGCVVTCDATNNPPSVLNAGDIKVSVTWRAPGLPEGSYYRFDSPSCSGALRALFNHEETLRSLKEYEGLTVEEARRRSPVSVKVEAQTVTPSAPSNQNVVTVIADDRGIIHYAVAGYLVPEN